MSVLATYAILFFSSSIIGVGLLSWTQKFYLQGQPELYLKSLPITAAVTLTLCVTIILIMTGILRPIDKIFNRVKNGDEPTDEDVQTVLNSSKKMNKVTIVSTIIGFVFGNLATILINIALGKNTFDPMKVGFAIIHSIGYGGVATMYTINLMDLFLSEKRNLLKIRKLDKNQTAATMSSSLTQMYIVSILAVSSTVAMVPFQIFVKGNTNLFGEGFNFYIVNTIFVLVVTFVLAAIPYFFILRGVTKRLRKNSEMIEEIASSGNLVNRLNIVVNDDFGLLTGSVNVLMDKLSGMISEIKQQSQNVQGAAGEISDAANSSVAALTQMESSLDRINSEGAEQQQIITNVSNDIVGLKEGAKELNDFMITQSAAMQQNSAVITEMAANINNVAEMTKKADVLITNLSKISDRGNELVTSSINAISDIQKASVEVQKIIKVIQAISSQTNLLSMNAAIEAAHAGEFGAGFAVVANEVRSLAASSTKSTKDIQLHIKDMVSKISVGVSASQQAGVAFNEIAESVKANQEIMESLSRAMEEQRIGAEENMKVTNQVSEALEQANLLAQKQSEFADSVKSTMDNVVALTEGISGCISQGLAATENMKNSISKVENSVSTNQAAVDSMEKQVSLFQV